MENINEIQANDALKLRFSQEFFNALDTMEADIKANPDEVALQDAFIKKLNEAALQEMAIDARPPLNGLPCAIGALIEYTAGLYAQAINLN